MKLAKAQFDGAVLSFATSELLPTLGNTWKTWLIAGGLPLMMPQAHAMLAQFGLEDEDGVDIDAIETFMTHAFNAQPKLEFPALGIGFDKTDAEKLITSLKSQQHNNTSPLFPRR
jgi:hypothetical protein